MNASSQRGSAIIMLFIAVALFGLLAYAFLQGTRGNVSMMTNEASKATGYQSQDCMNSLNMAVKRLTARNCGAMISAALDGSNTNPGAPTDGSCSIYHTNGGGIKPCSTVNATGPANCTGKGDAYYNDPASGHCYFKEADMVTHDAAQSACAANSGYLAAITSSAEETMIDTHLNLNALRQEWWFGIDDVAIEGKWVYSYGELAGTQFWSGNELGSSVGGKYNNWLSGPGGEPNNFAPDNCALITKYTTTVKWYDFYCGWARAYLCEISGTP